MFYFKHYISIWMYLYVSVRPVRSSRILHPSAFESLYSHLLFLVLVPLCFISTTKGRTGRFGKKGVSLALITKGNATEKAALDKFMSYTGIPIHKLNMTSTDISEHVGSYTSG